MRIGLGIGLNRFRVGQAAAITGLLDQFTGAAAAFSLDTLIYGDHSVEDTAVGSQTNGSTDTYTVRVRRSSDNAVRSFTHTEVGDGTLVTWVGAGNDGFVEDWYNQGSAGDAVQTTAANQPKIVDAGSLVVENGKAALDYPPGDTNMSTPHVLASGFAFFTVAKYSTSVKALIANSYLSSIPANRYVIGEIGLGNISFRSSGTTDTGYPSTNALHLGTFVGDGSGNVSAYFNSSFSESSTGNETNFSGNTYIGGLEGPADRTFEGNMQCIVIYNNVVTTNRLAIESALNDYYEIY
jgi:hypothetical protein